MTDSPRDRIPPEITTTTRGMNLSPHRILKKSFIPLRYRPLPTGRIHIYHHPTLEEERWWVAHWEKKAPPSFERDLGEYGERSLEEYLASRRNTVKYHYFPTWQEAWNFVVANACI